MVEPAFSVVEPEEPLGTFSVVEPDEPLGEPESRPGDPFVDAAWEGVDAGAGEGAGFGAVAVVVRCSDA